MKRMIVALVAAMFGALASGAAAQVPPDVAARIRALGPVIDVPALLQIYGPLQAAMSKDGVQREVDLAYGPDAKNVLDVYAPAARPAGAPVLVFVPGGAFMRSEKGGYANVGYSFAQHGIVTMVMSYRVAPANVWPAGSRDVAAAVAFAQHNAARYGGDPQRIFLMAHSAGAAHAAAFAFMRALQPPGGPGLAGVILVSGVYSPALDALAAADFGGPPVLGPDRAYYGADPARYADESTLLHLDGPRLPVLLVDAELDPLMMQVQTPALFVALCRRDGACPQLHWLAAHDHLSEVYAIGTGDESLSKPVLDFISAAR
jgi:triacylglycerol lipase